MNGRIAGCKILISAIQTEGNTPALKVDCSKGSVYWDFYRMCTNYGVHELLEGEEFKALEMVYFLLGRLWIM